MVRLAILPDGLGGNGSTSCALALGAATIRQDRLTASSSAFVAQDIAAPSIIVFVLAVMCVLPELRAKVADRMKGKVTSRGGVRSSHFSTEGVSDTPCPRLTFANSPSQNFADPLSLDVPPTLLARADEVIE